MFKFTRGRQGSNYFKCKLWSFWRTDAYIIKCIDDSIQKHTDPVKKGKHFRLNITISGDDKFNGKTIFKWWRFCFFRPDINEHWTEKSSWTMISFGFLI